MSPPVSWVVGRGGLLGQHAEQALRVAGEVWAPSTSFSWHGSDIEQQIDSAVVAFTEHVSGRPWRVAWCAGGGIVSSAIESLHAETAVLERLLNSLGAAVRSERLGTGAFFYASSAGALYAGSARPPFDEVTVPQPLAPYGWEKLRQEQMITQWSDATGVPSLRGRISNLYGPGQDLAKPQGLISQLCWTQLLQRPLSIYVPLSTLRDYLYAPDCGRMVRAGLEGLEDAAPPGASLVKVMASRRPISIGAVLGEFRRTLRRLPRMSLRSSPRSQHQVVDLRVRSVTTDTVDHCATTPFPTGLLATYSDLLRRFAHGS